MGELHYKSKVINLIDNFILNMKKYYSFRVISLVSILLFLTFTVCTKSNIDFSDVNFSKLSSII
jgi:hypothetical protein